MAISYTTANDIADLVLDKYIRGKSLAQTIQERPLLKALNEKKKTFSAGKTNVSLSVKGQFMSDTAGFFAGYSGADSIAATFKQSENVIRAIYAWKEMVASLVISWTELKQVGIHVEDNQKTSKSSGTELEVLSDILVERLSDFGESFARSMNTMLWGDGSQDSSQIPGVAALLTTTPGVGSTGGISRVTKQWWRNRYQGNITVSPQNQTLSKTLRSELRLLRRYLGRPDVAVCGREFIEGLESELTEKGLYTQEGFANSGKTDLGVADISLRGLGTFRYDPSLDDNGFSKRCVVYDSRRLTLFPMSMEENKSLTPERPYDQLVFLKSMTYTGALCINQLNACAIYEIA